jgi:chromate transporter
MQSDNPLATLFLVFLPLSLTAFGGGISILPAMQHQSVDVYQWVTDEQFLALFAISRGAPGPGSMMLATLIGWNVAGFAGAAVTTFAMFGPASALCLTCGALLHRFRGRRVMVVLERAVAPVGAGLVLAGLLSLTELASASWVLLGIAVGSGVICVAFPMIHPFIVIGGGALINFLVVVLNW